MEHRVTDVKIKEMIDLLEELSSLGYSVVDISVNSEMGTITIQPVTRTSPQKGDDEITDEKIGKII
jgi:hypothetical protein